MGLSFVAVFLYAGSLSTSEIVAAQSSRWFVVTLPVSFIYVIAMVGETNRAPFDLPEAESELVGGFHTEYTSLKFAMFFLAEYINVVTVSALATTLFLGGWRPPPFLSRVAFLSEGYFPIVWFLAKVLLFIFFFIWLRGTLPRMRYDQFMKLGWKVLIPVSLVWILLVASIRTLSTQVASRTDRITYIGIAVIVLFALFYAIPQKKPPTAEELEADNGLASLADGGFPTPPMDLIVPPTPRSLQLASGPPASADPARNEEPTDG